MDSEGDKNILIVGTIIGRDFRPSSSYYVDTRFGGHLWLVWHGVRQSIHPTHEEETKFGRLCFMSEVNGRHRANVDIDDDLHWCGRNVCQ